MAIPGQTQGTYNYNTLVRTNDGTAFEFNTNATVLFVDELPSGVTINASFDSPSNPQILLREKVQLRFKATNRIIFTPSASTSGTIRIFLFFDESNPDEFDMSFFSTEVVGTSDQNLVSISGDTDIVTDGYYNITKSLGATRGSVNLSGSTTGTATLFTVPANFRFLITSVQIACDTSTNSVLARLQLEDTSGNASILSAIVQHSSLLGSVNASFPLPVVANATDTLVMVDGGGSATPTFMVAGNLVSV
jgi:hypothetical protein